LGTSLKFFHTAPICPYWASIREDARVGTTARRRHIRHVPWRPHARPIGMEGVSLSAVSCSLQRYSEVYRQSAAPPGTLVP
jgi:hypothetical protein